MIVYKKKTQVPLYGNYFLFEAPGDEGEERPRNMRNISVLPDNRRRTDFTDGATEGLDEPGQEPAPNPDPPPTETDSPADEDLGQGEDFTNDPGTTTDQPAAPQTGDTPPAEGDAGDTNDDPNEDMGEGEDFTGGGDNLGGEETDPNAPPADPGTDPNAGAKPGPGVDFEATRKYTLYKEFLNLMDAIDVYVERLENYYIDDSARNKIIRTSIEKLSEIKDQIYEYIMMRFELASYVQALMFYQKMRVSILLVFNLLEKIRYINKMQEELKTKGKKLVET